MSFFDGLAEVCAMLGRYPRVVLGPPRAFGYIEGIGMVDLTDLRRDTAPPDAPPGCCLLKK